jgi:hypothetical protein
MRLSRLLSGWIITFDMADDGRDKTRSCISVSIRVGSDSCNGILNRNDQVISGNYASLFIPVKCIWKYNF